MLLSNQICLFSNSSKTLVHNQFSILSANRVALNSFKPDRNTDTVTMWHVVLTVTENHEIQARSLFALYFLYDPHSKQQSCIWELPSVQQTATKWKVCQVVFNNWKCHLHHKFIRECATINNNMPVFKRNSSPKVSCVFCMSITHTCVAPSCQARYCDAFLRHCTFLMSHNAIIALYHT
jgi:hypothetical protein